MTETQRTKIQFIVVVMATFLLGSAGTLIFQKHFPETADAAGFIAVADRRIDCLQARLAMAQERIAELEKKIEAKHDNI